MEPRLTGDAIVQAIASGMTPATVLGVPFHIGLLASVQQPPKLPQFKRMTTGGELVPAAVSQSFEDKYGVPLGNMYGMTEVAVIGTIRAASTARPSARHRASTYARSTAISTSAARNRRTSASPTRPAGPLAGCGRGAGVIDPETGLVTEVEYALGTLRGVETAVVVFDGSITAYLQLNQPREVGRLETELAERPRCTNARASSASSLSCPAQQQGSSSAT